MPSEINPNDPRNLWQGQEVENLALSIEEVRSKAARLERRVHWRNMREYAAGALVAAFWTPQLWHAHGWRLTPAVLSILGVIYVMFQLHRRGSARSLPADVGLTASIEFHRRELERQRDALHTVWHWYLLPFMPGLAAVLVVTAIDRGINARLIGTGVCFVLTFGAVWALNEWAARKLDRKVEELKAMEADND